MALEFATEFGYGTIIAFGDNAPVISLIIKKIPTHNLKNTELSKTINKILVLLHNTDSKITVMRCIKDTKHHINDENKSAHKMAKLGFSKKCKVNERLVMDKPDHKHVDTVSEEEAMIIRVAKRLKLL